MQAPLAVVDVHRLNSRRLDLTRVDGGRHKPLFALRSLSPSFRNLQAPQAPESSKEEQMVFKGIIGALEPFQLLTQGRPETACSPYHIHFFPATIHVASRLTAASDFVGSSKNFEESCFGALSAHLPCENLVKIMPFASWVYDFAVYILYTSYPLLLLRTRLLCVCVD